MAISLSTLFGTLYLSIFFHELAKIFSAFSTILNDLIWLIIWAVIVLKKIKLTNGKGLKNRFLKNHHFQIVLDTHKPVLYDFV